MAISFIVWYIYGIVKSIPFFQKREGDTSTPKDYFIITVGSLMYLMFPTLIAGTFKMFDCRKVGKFSYLHVDLQEKCYQGRHLDMVLALGVSRIFAYVLGLPVLMLVFLLRNRDRLDANVVLSRYGLFYAGYKRDKFYWETVLSLRKIGIVALGIFGPAMGPVRQSVFAILILSIFIVLEIIGRPFKETSPRHYILARLGKLKLGHLFSNH